MWEKTSKSTIFNFFVFNPLVLKVEEYEECKGLKVNKLNNSRFSIGDVDLMVIDIWHLCIGKNQPWDTVIMEMIKPIWLQGI